MKYLQEADHDEAMEVFYGPDKEPHTHTVWTGDFMGMCKHDIACPVCMNNHAVISRNVTPGQFSQAVKPCRSCQDEGWKIINLPPFVRWILTKTGIISK